MVGQADMLEMNKAIDHWKQSSINLDALLTPHKNHMRIRALTKLKHKTMSWQANLTTP
ncbi:Glutamate synthase [NADPH] large chain (EC [uncultured Gammaproteobacteria bacterium]|nr:Glutamate synthase [NADPH] large chain (EC [uncultured Gammaproteobacteria bacterium]